MFSLLIYYEINFYFLFVYNSQITWSTTCCAIIIVPSLGVLFCISCIFLMRGKRADVSPHSKRLSPLIDTRKTRGVTSALPDFAGWENVLGSRVTR